MSEASEIARSLIAKHGKPTVRDHDAACHWISAVWPDWFEWISGTMRDNVASAVLALTREEA